MLGANSQASYPSSPTHLGMALGAYVTPSSYFIRKAVIIGGEPCWAEEGLAKAKPLC